MADLDVIIFTSPHRQTHLKSTLQGLTRQTLKANEIIIIDDGSEGMDAIIEPYKNQLNISYYHRQNDGNLSLSRNLGVKYSSSSSLVFMNGDIILNPNALKYYRYYLSLFPHATLWGYVGCRKKHQCPSTQLEKVTINWLDFRFFPLSENEYFVHSELESSPHKLAGGHHFALRKKTFESIGGFDETFHLWGEEDVEFALRGLLKGHPMHFVGDSWAEHIHHEYQEDFHKNAPQQLRHKLQKIIEGENLLFTKEITPPLILFKYELASLWRLTNDYYLQYNPSALQEELKHAHFKRSKS